MSTADDILARYDTAAILQIDMPALGPAGSTAEDILHRFMANAPLLAVPVPEFGYDDNGDPVTFFIHPITAKNCAKVDMHARGIDEHVLACSIIFRALNEDGKPIFTLAHKPHLLDMSSTTISDVVVRMRNACTPEAISPCFDAANPFIARFRRISLRDSQEIRRLGNGERNRYMAAEMAWRLLDSEGNRVFSDNQVDDLMELPDGILADFTLRTKEAEQLRSVEDLVKA